MKKHLLITTFYLLTCFTSIFAQDISAGKITKVPVKPFQVTGSGVNLFTVTSFYKDVVQLTTNRFVFVHKLGGHKAYAYLFDENFQLLENEKEIRLPEDGSYNETQFMTYSPNGNVFSVKKNDKGLNACIISYSDNELMTPAMTELDTYDKSSDFTTKLSSTRNSACAIFSPNVYSTRKIDEEVTIGCSYYSSDKNVRWDNKTKITLKPGQFVKVFTAQVSDNGNVYFIMQVSNNASQFQQVYACKVNGEEFETTELKLPPNALTDGYRPFSSFVYEDGNLGIVMHEKAFPYYANTGTGGEFIKMERDKNSVVGFLNYSVGKNRFLSYAQSENTLYIAIYDNEGKSVENAEIQIGTPPKKWFYYFSSPFFINVGESQYLFYINKENSMAYMSIKDGEIVGKDDILLTEINLNIIEGYFSFKNKNYLWTRKTQTKGQTEEFVFIEI